MHEQCFLFFGYIKLIDEDVVMACTITAMAEYCNEVVGALCRNAAKSLDLSFGAQVCSTCYSSRSSHVLKGYMSLKGRPNHEGSSSKQAATIDVSLCHLCTVTAVAAADERKALWACRWM